MERVGHNEPRTTLAVYTHVTDEMKSELNNAINKIGSAISHKQKNAPTAHCMQWGQIILFFWWQNRVIIHYNSL